MALFITNILLNFTFFLSGSSKRVPNLPNFWEMLVSESKYFSFIFNCPRIQLFNSVNQGRYLGEGGSCGHLAWKNWNGILAVEMLIWLQNNCFQVFDRLSSFMKHVSEHGDQRAYFCNVCGAFFGTKSKLTRHLLTHSGKIEWRLTYWKDLNWRYCRRQIVRMLSLRCQV